MLHNRTFILERIYPDNTFSKESYCQYYEDTSIICFYIFNFVLVSCTSFTKNILICLLECFIPIPQTFVSYCMPNYNCLW